MKLPDLDNAEFIPLPPNPTPALASAKARSIACRDLYDRSRRKLIIVVLFAAGTAASSSVSQRLWRGRSCGSAF